ncbi:MAG: class B sortase [Lachnospiraceae bacterium]|nr:class B sortase [Lachnospiraceae bacterium]
MMQQEYKVAGRTFRNKIDYQAAQRDQERIDKIKEKTDFLDSNQVHQLLRDLQNNRYHFETLLGEDFYDEVIELEKQVKTTSLREHSTDVPNKNIHSINEYDKSMQQEILRQLKKQERKRKIMLLILGILATCCIAYVGVYYYFYEKNSMDYDNLAKMKSEQTGYTVTLSQQEDIPPILEKYEELYKKNKRLIGWLKIDDTNIDYPVMQTVNNEYYLDHNFNQEYDKNGSLFLDKDCNAAFPNTNMIIYGHHMKSGKMFGQLNYYSKESYYKEHPQIHFDTIYEEGLYDVMYVFRSRIYNEEEIVFKYYQFFDVNSADEFNSYMEEMQKLSLYDTGVTASYGDKLLTLSTCDSSEEDGRFVVVAKKVRTQ